MNRKVKRIIKEIEELFSDTSYSQEATLESLEHIVTELEFKIGAIRADLKRKSKGEM